MPHHYDIADLPGERASFESLKKEIAGYQGQKDVRVAVTEWNTTAGQMGLTRGMLLTLGNALSVARYQNLMHRYADLVEIAVRSNLSDSFGSGMLQPVPAGSTLARPTTRKSFISGLREHTQWRLIAPPKSPGSSKNRI